MKQALSNLIASLDEAFPEAFETELEKRLPELVKAAGKWGTNPASEQSADEPEPPPAGERKPRASSAESEARMVDILAHAMHHESQTFNAAIAADWAGVDPRNVSPLLRKLVEAGKLKKFGEKRNTIYSLAQGGAS